MELQLNPKYNFSNSGLQSLLMFHVHHIEHHVLRAKVLRVRSRRFGVNLSVKKGRFLMILEEGYEGRYVH